MRRGCPEAANGARTVRDGLVSKVLKLFVMSNETVTVRHVKQRYQSPMSRTGTDGNDLVRNSSLYREFQAERDEILKHKWIESEKAGHDIGFEQALTEWIVKYRAKWRKDRQKQAEKEDESGDAEAHAVK